MNTPHPDYAERKKPVWYRSNGSPPPRSRPNGSPPPRSGQMAPHLQGPGQMAPHPQYGQPVQPMMSSQHTTVVINQPATVQNDRIIGSRGGHRDWSTGLFSCCDDVGKCIYAWYCPCCVLAEISARLGECLMVTCCVPGGLVTVRTRVRTLGGIRGSICMDYLATAYCQPCVMCQIHRELDYMGL